MLGWGFCHKGMAMKNKMIDLNNHLFVQLERLNDERLKGDKLDDEIRRSVAISRIARDIISVGALMLNAKIAVGESIPGNLKIPETLE